MFKLRIKNYIEKLELFSISDKVLVALSGGADSVAMLRVLVSLGYNCQAAHCNFHLRGKESDEDEIFVRALCQSMGIPLQVAHFDTKAYATEKKISIEMAARELRYEWFAKIKEESQATIIAVAHHRDDSIETMLLNLIRGTGINGLLGIQPKNGDIVRPLLCVTRQEVIEYLNHIGQGYVTDSTNHSDDYTRNKIRLKLIPLMEEINPSVKQSLSDTANHLSETATIYNRYINKAKTRVLTGKNIDISKLLNESSPKALLFEILHPLRFNSPQIESIFQSLNGQSGKQFISKKGYRVVKDRNLLLIHSDKKHCNQISDNPPFDLEIKEIAYSPDFTIPKDKLIACFDATKVEQPFTIRKWKHGDLFIPFGMNGKKLVSDYLTDRKFSLIEKENQWVLCSGDNIAWLIGERTDNRFRIDQTTERIIIIRMKYTIRQTQ